MKKCPSLIAVVLLAAWSGLAFTAEPQPSVLVTTTPMREGSLAKTVTAYGTVVSLPSAKRMVSAHASETVGEVYVHEGDEAPAGAPLLQLVPGAQTAAAFVQAQSALQDAEQQVARTRRMLAQHLATSQQLANDVKALSDAKVALDALKAQGAGGAKTLRAPFRAIVSHVTVAPGALVASGTPLVELENPNSLTLRVGVTPPEARLINMGNTVAVTALAGHEALDGAVLRRGSLIDPATGLVLVDISLPADHLFPGEAARAAITVGQTQGFVVPHSAILVDNRGKPYVVQADGKNARKVPVQVAGTYGDEDVIHGAGLKADQPLVLTGNYQLEDGMQIRLADETARVQK
ncbi:MAG: efflux RND transporter periplasmic adaptor subunit [Burkholderiaceae bacterium]|nr:MAG: efflux RND transporter periplasmic adaptor subunit [Burkholderiaceae bacterium]TAM08059.1 MAG: efflux RND transporter periplasmic adaptor subunit [Pusillimonas sp.]